MKKLLTALALIVSIGFVNKAAVFAEPSLNPNLNSPDPQPAPKPNAPTQKDQQKLKQTMDGAIMSAEERRALWDIPITPIDPVDTGEATPNYWANLFAPMTQEEKSLPKPNKPEPNAKDQSSNKEKSLAEKYPVFATLSTYGLAPLGLAAAAVIFGLANSWGPLAVLGVGFAGFLLTHWIVNKKTENKKDKKTDDNGITKFLIKWGLPAVAGLAGFLIASLGGFGLMWKMIFAGAASLSASSGVQALEPEEKQEQN